MNQNYRFINFYCLVTIKLTSYCFTEIRSTFSTKRDYYHGQTDTSIITVINSYQILTRTTTSDMEEPW